ncbi:MAG: hypothetical protein NTU91_10050 [Chloroflexi bacterium]|jgi:hypothetical protein|nr:hypothetical protein [Chloroflexota bacterium]
MSAFLLAVVLLTGLFLAASAPSLLALYRWWFGGGKLLNDRLGHPSAPPSRRRR